MSHLTCEENPKALSSPDIRGNKNSREHISAIQDLFRSLTRSKARVYIFAMRPRIYFNPFHVIHLYVSPTSFDLISIYGIFTACQRYWKHIRFNLTALSSTSLSRPIHFHLNLSIFNFNSRVSREIIFICYSIVLTKRSTFWPQLTTFEGRLKWT